MVEDARMTDASAVVAASSFDFVAPLVLPLAEVVVPFDADAPLEDGASELVTVSKSAPMALRPPSLLSTSIVRTTRVPPLVVLM